MDYEISYGGQTYRVIALAGRNDYTAHTVSDLGGYTLALANWDNASLNGSSITVPQNGICVLKK